MVQVQEECIALVPRALNDANCLSSVCHTRCMCASMRGKEGRRSTAFCAQMPSVAPHLSNRGSGCSAQRTVPAFNL
uniref:Uncharacterized protein n=1 Tax=Wuchereria bancrofti TaxID=6293 RepID=A0AAF5PPX3_WUCBA